MHHEKPYAPACDQNKAPILAVLRRHLPAQGTLLEIGSGTGQHAVHFAAAFPRLTWITSDLPEHHPGIRAWLDEAGLPNLRGPLALDVKHADWPIGAFDAVFSANTAHIMDWPSVESLFRGVSRSLRRGGVFCLYGPFHYGGRPSAESNARFDAWLRARDPASGVRNFEDLDALAEAGGLRLREDVPMPADNRTLVWTRP
ncbi:DUF938 domain-containing protein [Ectothiorhodospiraceae bacterium 2226]|nr:DUF938 domain-containing protein [Ectothiorhodospiraceae bacterium 2226]